MPSRSRSIRSVARKMPAERARHAAVRKWHRERRIDPVVVLDVDRPFGVRAQLAGDLAEVAPARERRRARRNRVQPHHAPRSGKLAQDVMIRSRVLVPVLRERDDRGFLHGWGLHPIIWGIATMVIAGLGCKKPVDPGPDLQIVGETLRLRPSDPVPRTSPWFDGHTVMLVAVCGVFLGLLVLFC